jgi:hypothetical protein
VKAFRSALKAVIDRSADILLTRLAVKIALSGDENRTPSPVSGLPKPGLEEGLAVERQSGRCRRGSF